MRISPNRSFLGQGASKVVPLQLEFLISGNKIQVWQVLRLHLGLSLLTLEVGSWDESYHTIFILPSTQQEEFRNQPGYQDLFRLFYMDYFHYSLLIHNSNEMSLCLLGSQQGWEELGYCLKPVWEKNTPKGQNTSESIFLKKGKQSWVQEQSGLALGLRGSFWSLIIKVNLKNNALCFQYRIT